MSFLLIFRPSLRADQKRELPCTDWRPCKGRATYRWTWWAIIRRSKPNSAWDRWCWKSRRNSVEPRRRSWGVRPLPRPRCLASWACVCYTAVRRRCILFGFCNLNRYIDREKNSCSNTRLPRNRNAKSISRFCDAYSNVRVEFLKISFDISWFYWLFY